MSQRTHLICRKVSRYATSKTLCLYVYFFVFRKLLTKTEAVSGSVLIEKVSSK